MKNSVKKIVALILAALLLLSAAACAETLQIGIPDDGTNLSRGIKLLETAGLIKVDPAAGYTPEIANVTEYLYDIEIVPMQANVLPSTLDDFAASTINGTYATSAGLVPSKDGILIEKQSEGGDNPYVNIIVCRTEDVDNEIFKTICAAYQNQLVAEFILARYEEAFYPAFAYDESIVMTAEEVQELADYESDEDGKTVVTVGVCGSKNEMWKVVQKLLDEQGANIYIELVEYDAYNLPNEALNSKDIDLNNFQHKAYLAKECDVNGYKLTAICDTLIAPLTLYSRQFESLDALIAAADPIAE